MELFSSSYNCIQAKYTSTPIPENITYNHAYSLDSFLIEQISNLIISELDTIILTRMVELLDENGLFTNWASAKEIIQNEFNISRRKTYELLHIFQELEPEGVGATSIKNFLEIQIEKHELEDEPFKANTLRILSFENELINHDLTSISAKTGLSLEDISLSLLFIKNNLVYTLPRQQFSTYNTSNISPSAKVSIKNGIFEIEMLEDFHYVKNVELLQILKERADLINKILIVFFQKQRPANFQKSGLLKPITQKTIAEITGLSASTISRLVNSKYLFIENKLFHFKAIFQRQVNNSNYSSLFIKKHMTKNINKTDKVLSEELEELGVNISRRTVNYYRNKFF
jgi:RNA polymerase sigma-54 factor